MNNLFSKIDEKQILVSDGAWGTELIKMGFQSGSCPELWNLEKPSEIFSIAKSYIDAGSDIISTNSFGASKIKLEQFNLSDKTYLINVKAAELSRKAANDKLVMGSVGPTGKFLMMGEISQEELRESFLLQLKGLIDGGVDAILFETFYDLDELKIGIEVARELNDIPIICSITFILTDNYIKIFPWEWVNYFFTFFWVVGLMNSLNMLDNMDAVTTCVSISIIYS